MKLNDQLKTVLSKGNYSTKQLLSKDPLIAWSHTSRFKKARRLLQRFRGQRLLDYGCGDGTFLLLNSDLFPIAVGVDASSQQIRQNETRLSEFPGLSFGLPEQFTQPQFEKKFDVITCMETLEHCPPRERQLALENVRYLLSPQGVLLVSVPLESGLSLWIKQFFRRLAALRNLGDYKYDETYRWGELFKMLFANSKTSIPRPEYKGTYDNGVSFVYHPHKGFNWMSLKEDLEKNFDIEKSSFSPVPFLGPVINSQVFFLCRPK